MRIQRKQIRAFWNNTLPDYWLHILPYWWCGALVSLSLLSERADIAEFDVPGWIWWTVIVATALLSQFLAYLDISRERDDLLLLRATRQHLQNISEFRSKLISMMNEQVHSEKEFGAWRQIYDSYRPQIISYISEKFGEWEAVLLKRFGTFPVFIVGGEINDEHTHYKSRMIRDQMWLDDMAKDYLITHHPQPIPDVEQLFEISVLRFLQGDHPSPVAPFQVGCPSGRRSQRACVPDLNCRFTGTWDRDHG